MPRWYIGARPRLRCVQRATHSRQDLARHAAPLCVVVHIDKRVPMIGVQRFPSGGVRYQRFTRVGCASLRQDTRNDTPCAAQTYTGHHRGQCFHGARRARLVRVSSQQCTQRLCAQLGLVAYKFNQQGERVVVGRRRVIQSQPHAVGKGGRGFVDHSAEGRQPHNAVLAATQDGGGAHVGKGKRERHLRVRQGQRFGPLPRLRLVRHAHAVVHGEPRVVECPHVGAKVTAL